MHRRVLFSLALGFLVSISIIGYAKSLYVVAEHHTGQFDAWNIEAPGKDPLIAYQATYNLSHSHDPAGVAVDNDSATLFITSEFDEGVELVDATTMTSLGWAPGASDLGGIDIDDQEDVIYTIERGTGNIYAYDWKPTTKTLTLRSGYPKALPNCSAAFGLTLDEIHGFLYVADVQSGVVRIYDTATLSEVSNFAPSFPPVGIAIDRNRKIVYTTAPDGTCASGTPTGNTLLSKYALTSGVETTVDMGHGGMGIAVDEVTGYVYVTSGCLGDDISVWDSDLNFVYSTGPIGNPAGIAIGNVSYNPLSLSKNDVLVGYGVSIGQEFPYGITFGNDSSSAITGAIIVDTLPPELDFVSETVNGTPNTGVYDPVTHTVTWDIGTLPAGYTGEIALVVRVNQNATGEAVLYNYCTIKSDQTPPTTVIGGDPDSPTDEPGTYIIVNPPPNTKIETAEIDQDKHTATFTWSGSDDSTPPAQLVYEHRLLHPNSPLYGWSDWSSSTTATYPRPGDSRLPDGTYRFQVKAKDADEAIQPSPTTYKFTIGGGNLAPIARAPDISGQPQTMYPDTNYTITAKYFDPDGRDDLKICYLQLKHPEKRLTMMWYQEDGHTSTYAGEEGANYLTKVKATATKITDTDGTEGYEIKWAFEINNHWPEVEGAIDFGVSASDDGNLESGWQYDNTNASFSIEFALNCVVQLWPQGGPGSIGVVSKCDEFDIYVGASTGDIGAVRFLGDASLNGSPDGDWTGWFDWNTNAVIGGWDASEKTKEWMFSSGGDKEVWVEIRNASSGLTARCHKNIKVTAPSYAPYPYGYKFANSSVFEDLDLLPWIEVVEGLTEQDKRVVFDETFDWSHILDPTYKDLLFWAYKDQIGTGGNCYGMVASSLMEYWYPDYDTVLEDQDLACDQEYLCHLDMSTVPLLGKWNGRNMQDKPTLKQILKFQLAQYGSAPKHEYVEYDQDPLKMVQVLEQSTDYVIGVGYRQRVKGKLEESGHALAAYKIEETAGVVKVYVYDPNYPDKDGDAKTGDADKAYDRYIEIDKSKNTWKYIFKWNSKGEPVYWPPRNAIRSFLGLFPISAHNYYDNDTPKPGGKLVGYPGQYYCLADGSVGLLLADNRGRLTGVSDNDYFEEIPGVKPVVDILGTPSTGATWRQAYYIENDTTLTTTVTGTDEGTYSVTSFGADLFSSISDIRTSEGTSDAFTFLDDGAELRFSDSEEPRTYDLVLHKTLKSGGQTFTATNIPTRAGTVHQYTINWDALAQGEEGVTLEIDNDGDGIIDRTVTTDGTLTGEDLGVIPPEESVNLGPNPVPAEGCVFWLDLPDGTSTAKLMIFNVTGRLLFETTLNVDVSRFPSAGTWNPVDRDGTPLANGPYVYVLIADGKVIGQGKMVIQR